MKILSNRISPLTLAAFVLSFFAFSGTAAAQDCSAITDAQIVATILDEIKGDSLLAPQISHIAVGSVNKFVKLQGWTDNKKSYDRLISIISAIKCVKAINVNRLEETPPPANSPLRRQSGGGCPAGDKPCGDICIPEGDSCNGAG